MRWRVTCCLIAGPRVTFDDDCAGSGDISPVITAYFEGEAGPHATSGPGPTSGKLPVCRLRLCHRARHGCHVSCDLQIIT